MIDQDNLQKAIIRENLEGWLFFNFHHKDAFADQLLRINPESMNSRRWFYFVPARGLPVKIVHAIEEEALDHLPGRKEVYAAADELKALLQPLACLCGSSFSESLTALSYLDHGTALFLENLGFILKPAEGLVQRAVSLLSEEGIKTHETAARHLYDIVDEIWKEIGSAFRSGKILTERSVQERILEKIEEKGLLTVHRPIVASGINSGNPHYSPGIDAPALRKGELIQFDLWGKLPGGRGVYADISQVGFTGPAPGPFETDLFRTVCAARDEAFRFISEKFTAGETVRGRDVDRAARRVLIESGYEEGLCHRTGHGIDRELHGWGVNMDAAEFPDSREILEGSCFSIEPGLYYKGRIGCRTEINVFIRRGRPVISGGPVQTKLRTLE